MEIFNIFINVLTLSLIAALFIYLKKNNKTENQLLSVVENQDKQPAETESFNEKPAFSIVEINGLDPLSNKKTKKKKRTQEESDSMKDAFMELTKLFPDAFQLKNAGSTYKVTFKPELLRGLKKGDYTFMQSHRKVHPIVMNKSGKIMGIGTITTDTLAQSVAGVAVVWQILATITAQKFMKDVNLKLAAIEEGIEGLQLWFRDKEQGKFSGNLEYLNDFVKALDGSIDAEVMYLYRNQIEGIYRESLEMVGANLRRADRAHETIVNWIYNGNIDQNANRFNEQVDHYFEAVSTVLKYRYLASASQYLIMVADGKQVNQLGRIEKLSLDSRDYMPKVLKEAREMFQKIGTFNVGFFQSQKRAEEIKSKLGQDLQTLYDSCSEANEKIQSVSTSAQQVLEFQKKISEKGLTFIVETKVDGSLGEIHEADEEKAS